MAELIKGKTFFIVGPTGAGKSSAALSWAEKYSGVIVNVDSLQVYQGLNIGTAKPSTKDFKRAPHYLFDIVEKGKTFTAGEYSRLMYELLPQVSSNHKLFFVGGSGFYFRAIEFGMYEHGAVPEPIRQQLDIDLKQIGLAALYDELRRVDPEGASQINPNDSYRIYRAVSVFRAFGVSMKEQQRRMTRTDEGLRDRFSICKIGLYLERERLRQVLLERVKNMLALGFVEEVSGLLQEGLADWTPLNSVGYREVCAHLSGQISKQEMVEQIVTSSMQLAKKQMTWFKKDRDIHWFLSDKELQKAEDFLSSNALS